MLELYAGARIQSAGGGSEGSGSPTYHALYWLASQTGPGDWSVRPGVKAVELLAGTAPLLRYAGWVYDWGGITVNMSWHGVHTLTGGFGGGSYAWTGQQAQLGFRVYLRTTAAGSLDRVVVYDIENVVGPGSVGTLTPLFDVPLPAVSVEAGRMIALDFSVYLGGLSVSYTGPAGLSEVSVHPGALLPAMARAFGPNWGYAPRPFPHHLIIYPHWTWWEYKTYTSVHAAGVMGAQTYGYCSVVFAFELPLTTSLNRFDFGNLFGGVGWSPAPSGAHEMYAVIGGGQTVMRQALDGMTGVVVSLYGGAQLFRLGYVVLAAPTRYDAGVTHFFMLGLHYTAALSGLWRRTVTFASVVYMGATYLTWW